VRNGLEGSEETHGLRPEGVVTILVTMRARRRQAPSEIKAGEFKAKCLELMDVVARTGASIVITKRGAPVARLVPAREPSTSIFGFARGSFEEISDIVASASPEWRPDAESLRLLREVPAAAPRRSRQVPRGSR
jgi:prevent-host-death family protein